MKVNSFSKVPCERPSTTHILSPVPPTVAQLLYLPTTQGIQDIQMIFLCLLPTKYLCNLLATCKDVQQLYLLLLTAAGQALVSDSFTAKQVFNQYTDHRLPKYILAGPGGEHRYARHVGITGGPLTFDKLRDGTLSEVEVRAQEKDSQARWQNLIDKFELPDSPEDQVEVAEMIGWLNEEMQQPPSKSEFPYLKKCILDESLPLESIPLENKINWRVTSKENLGKFEAFLYAICLDPIPGNNKDELTNAELQQLFEFYYCVESEDIFEFGSQIFSDEYVQKALKNEELRLSHLVQLYACCYVLSFFFEALSHPVTRARLDADVLTVMLLMRLYTDYAWQQALNPDDIEHYFLSDQFDINPLIRLLEKQDDLATITFSRAMNNPVIRGLLHVQDVEQAALCWQHLFSLLNQEGTWLRYLKTRPIPHHNDIDEQMVLLSCCNLLTKLSMSLTTQAIEDYVCGESEAHKLTLSQLSDQIVREEENDASVIPLILEMLFRETVSDTPFCNVLDRCKITPFHYPKFALALMHPEVRTQYEAGTLSWEELKEKLKGDPLSGYRIALFGLSDQHDIEYKNRIENNFANALPQFQKLLLDYYLTMEQLITVVREDRRISINGSDKEMWEFIIHDRAGLYFGVSFSELMQTSDEGIALIFDFTDFQLNQTPALQEIVRSHKKPGTSDVRGQTTGSQ